MNTVISGDIDIVLDTDTRTNVDDDGGILMARTANRTPITVRVPEPVLDRLVRDAQILRPDIYGSPNSELTRSVATLQEENRVLRAELERAQRITPSVQYHNVVELTPGEVAQRVADGMKAAEVEGRLRKQAQR